MLFNTLSLSFSIRYSSSRVYMPFFSIINTTLFSFLRTTRTHKHTRHTGTPNSNSSANTYSSFCSSYSHIFNSKERRRKTSNKRNQKRKKLARTIFDLCSFFSFILDDAKMKMMIVSICSIHSLLTCSIFF